jgi:Zn-dependent protease with chaperone function
VTVARRVTAGGLSEQRSCLVVKGCLRSWLSRPIRLWRGNVLAIGLLAVFAPLGRGAIVERRLGLAAQRRPIIAEIEDFLREHGATVEVRCNLARQDRLARIYPVGWRRARLAVFGPFAALWRRDRPAAQAVLLHEIAHVRTGDQLFLGLGGPFVALINLWFPLLVILGVIPLTGLALTQYPTAGLLAGQLLLVLTLLPEALLLPVGALWLAELSADRYVADAGLRDGLLRSLDTNERRGGRYLAALARLSHPPRALRIWALRGGLGRDVALLACWPLLLLPLLLVTLAAAVPNLLLIGDSGQQLVESATRGSAGFLAYNRHTWIPAVVLLLVWPAVARPWTRWWAGHAADRLSMPSRTHLVAAVLVAAVFLVLRLLMQ